MRHAIYFTPAQDDPLTEAAARWLGRDAFTGAELEQPAVREIPPDELRAITADPRRYGFHATIKAPFRLAEGCSQTELDAALGAFAKTVRPFSLDLSIDNIDGFFALAPARHSADLQSLAGKIVEEFDAFRAPLTAQDLARRRPEQLSPQERHNLERWGYPHVFDLFGFHMTLTQRIDPQDRSRIRVAIDRIFADAIARPVLFDALASFVEAEPGAPFVVRSRHLLGA